jgi:hypothetical protein
MDKAAAQRRKGKLGVDVRTPLANHEKMLLDLASQQQPLLLLQHTLNATFFVTLC